MENQNYIMREITPLSERDCFYIANRHKTEFTYPIHCHTECELNFTEHAAGVKRVVWTKCKAGYHWIFFNRRYVWSEQLRFSYLPE